MTPGAPGDPPSGADSQQPRAVRRRAASGAEGEPADGELFGQPHGEPGEGSVARAEAIAAEISTEVAPLGTLGKPFNWRTPFFIGLAACAGVAVTAGAIWLLFAAGHVIVLVGLSLFLAIGMEPATSWLVVHRLPRWLAVAVVLLAILGVLGGFLAVAIPVVTTQIEHLIVHMPYYLRALNNHSTAIGRISAHFKLEERLRSLLTTSGAGTLSGVISAGENVFSAFADTLIVIVLTVYFLADMPRVRSFLYRFVPNSRRPRAILIGDDILAKVGVYVLGNLLVSLVAGILTFVWLVVFHVPYPLLLAVLVALLDLVPVVGATLGGLIAAAVALTVSVPVAVATVAFFLLYRLLEDYLLVPRIIGRSVRVPSLVTIVAVLVGGALLGVLGALVAIPFAAAVLLILREVAFPRLDQI